MPLLISCWLRLAQQVRTLSLKSSKPTIQTLFTISHLAAEHPRQHNRRGLCPDCSAARQKARWSWVCSAAETRPLTSPGAAERYPAGKRTHRRTADGCLAEASSAAAFHGTTLVPLSVKCTFVLPVLDTATDTITLSLKCLGFLMRRSLGTVFPIVFPVKLGCFHQFYPIYKLLKIFARNMHILLKIDYILTCVIYFKCALLF